jgi:hypothetical protein
MPQPPDRLRRDGIGTDDLNRGWRLDVLFRPSKRLFEVDIAHSAILATRNALAGVLRTSRSASPAARPAVGSALAMNCRSSSPLTANRESTNAGRFRVSFRVPGVAQHDVSDVASIYAGGEFLRRSKNGRDGYFVILKIPQVLVA